MQLEEQLKSESNRLLDFLTCIILAVILALFMLRAYIRSRKKGGD